MISLWMPLAVLILTTGSLKYKADSISVCNPIRRILGNVLIHEQKVQMKTLLNELRNSRIPHNTCEHLVCWGTSDV